MVETCGAFYRISLNDNCSFLPLFFQKPKRSIMPGTLIQPLKTIDLLIQKKTTGNAAYLALKIGVCKKKVKKNIILIHTFISICILPNLLFSQPIPPAEIIIFGVFHNENEYRNSQLLLPLIKQLNPDIILSETDTLSGYFTADYQLKKPPIWYKIFSKAGLAQKMPPEHEVLYLLKKENENMVFYPFDIAIQNRRKYVKTDKAFEKKYINDLNTTYDTGGIPEIFAEQHKNLIHYSNYLFSLGNTGYEFMNRPIITDSIRNLMALEYAYLPVLLDTIAALNKYKSTYMERKAYWEVRNQKMADNILSFVRMHPGKRIVVLTGLLHKYILTDLLKPKQQIHAFKLKEWMN
jgi:hypothetical protein